MSLPPALQHACQALAGNLMQAPLLHPTPHQRRMLYKAFGPWDAAFPQRVRAWLAVFAAQRALPIYQSNPSRFPDDDLPAQLIDTALQVLHGRAEPQRVKEMAEWGYNAAGHCWGYDEDELPFHIDCAGHAAYHALGGATHDLYFLQDLDTGYGMMTPKGVHIISGAEWTNQRLLDFARAVDTALYAAAALATNPVSQEWEPQPWQAFWMWWLDEAIPMAWEQTLLD
jgi:Immunity protein Imm5